MAIYKNINFPFKDSPKGFFLDLTETDDNAIKADLTHLLLTKKGERLYMPDFGTDLYKFIYDQNDGRTKTDIKLELQETIKKYIPNLVINDIKIEDSELSDQLVTIHVDYTVTEDTFKKNDFIKINL
jgi:phage baseplate assembly protein W